MQCEYYVCLWTKCINTDPYTRLSPITVYVRRLYAVQAMPLVAARFIPFSNHFSSIHWRLFWVHSKVVGSRILKWHLYIGLDHQSSSDSYRISLCIICMYEYMCDIYICSTSDCISKNNNSHQARMTITWQMKKGLCVHECVFSCPLPWRAMSFCMGVHVCFSV